MAEAVQIAVPQGGVPPTPAGAIVTERLPSPQAQTPGYVANPQNAADQFAIPQTDAQKAAAAKAAGISPEDYQAFLEFKAFKEKQGKPPATPEPTKPEVPVSPVAALDLAVTAARHDPMLDSMLGIFDTAAKGIDRSRALGNALTHADPNLIDKAYLREVGGENGERLIQIAQGIVNHCNAMADAAQASVFKIAGGEAQWGASAAAFSKGAPDHLKQYVASALNSGSKSQIDAAAQTVVEWAKSSGLVPTAGSGFVDTGAGAPGSAQGLSKAEFQKAHAALDKNDRNYERLKGELYGRRAIGKQLGL